MAAFHSVGADFATQRTSLSSAAARARATAFAKSGNR